MGWRGRVLGTPSFMPPEQARGKMWDATSGQETLRLQGHTGWVYSVAFSPDGKRIASDKTLKVWDATSGQERLTLKGHTSYVWSVAFSPDGKRIVSGSWDGTLKVWDASKGQASFRSADTPAMTRR